MSLQFGNFTAICRDSYLAVCNLWTPQPTRSCTLTQYQVSGGSVKNIGDVAICGISIVLVLIVMYRTYKKQAAVGRSEMNILYTFFAVQLTFQLITSGGFVSDTTMQMLSGLQMGFVVGFFWVLMVNGFVGYQWIEDGSWVSWLGTLLSGLVWTVVVTVLALDVPFKITGGNTSTSMYFSSQLFGLYLLFPLILIFIYIVAETVLVYQYLGDQKPLVNLLAALVLFVASQVLMFSVSGPICQGTNGASDGSLFASFCNLSAVLFVYRFWDSITEDEWENPEDIAAV